MDICIIGSGYVGLTLAGMLASLGHDVTCVDKDETKIQTLRQGQLPIFEPGLQELYETHSKHLQFSHEVEKIVQQSSVVFIAVGTPAKEDGSTDLTHIQSVVRMLSNTISSYKTIIVKSTVPPGTNKRIRQILLEKGVDAALFRMVSNPEFLREGSAVHDMLYPDRTVIGLEEGDTDSLAVMKKVYEGVVAPLIVTNLAEAEMIKYTANAFLAMKISFINEIARVCDHYEVDIQEVAKGIGHDVRINPHFLQAGIGYGGSCFPKDIRSLIHTAQQKQIAVPLLQATTTINETQADLYIEKLRRIQSRGTVAVLGIAFKPNTGDTRYSVALVIIEKLLAAGYTVKAYDPQAIVPDPFAVTQCSTVSQAVEGADALFIATDWEVCKQLDFATLSQRMKGHIIIDGRNCLQPDEVRRHGFTYIGMGRK